MRLSTCQKITISLLQQDTDQELLPISAQCRACRSISNLASNEHDATGLPLIYNLTLSENTPANGFTVTLTYTIEAGS